MLTFFRRADIAKITAEYDTVSKRLNPRMSVNGGKVPDEHMAALPPSRSAVAPAL
jgi:hypothetical protein